MTREEAVETIKVLLLKIEQPTDIQLGWLETWVHKEDIQSLRMAIKALEQEPKTGHWIWCGGSHKCSNCEEYTCFSFKKPPRYCPNCGCRMVEPLETETWNGMHGQITAPKGTFEKIFNDADDDNDI